MRLKGEDVSEGLREWVKSELKEGPKHGYDLGKFFFSVSAGSIGAIAAIEKLSSVPKLDCFLILSLALFFISILISITFVFPRIHSIGGETDLLSEYERQVTNVKRLTWGWFIIWLVGALIGCYAVSG